MENGRGARKVQSELEKLGFWGSGATVSRYLPKRRPTDAQRQRWTTFLRNHRDAIAAMDFLVVPTVRFKLLYVWFVIEHDRRHLRHVNVTAHPTSSWTVQQLRETFPGEASTRFLIHDNDTRPTQSQALGKLRLPAIFSDHVTEAINQLGMEPKRTAYRSPWQNGTAEPWVGTVRRELLDHVIVIDESHLRRLLREYVDCYNGERVHTRLCDSPVERPWNARRSIGRRRAVESSDCRGLVVFIIATRGARQHD